MPFANNEYIDPEDPNDIGTPPKNHKRKFNALERMQRVGLYVNKIPIQQVTDPRQRLWRMLRYQLGVKFLSLILLGMEPAQAAVACGVTKESFHAWMNAGRKQAYKVEQEGGKYTLTAMFYLQTKSVEAYQKAETLEMLQEATANDPKLLSIYLQFLERINEESYGKKGIAEDAVKASLKIVIEQVGGKDWLNGKKAALDGDVIDSSFSMHSPIGDAGVFIPMIDDLPEDVIHEIPE